MCKEDHIELLSGCDVLQSASCRELKENLVSLSRNSNTPEPCYSPSTSPAEGDGSPSVAAASTAIFFARVPPMVPYKDLHTLFSRFGAVQDLNLFRRWATAKTSKGCGIVQFSTAEEANRALQALHGVYTFEGFPGCEGPMVVEWMDPSKLNASNDSTTGSKASKPVKERRSASNVLGRLWGRAGSSSNSINSHNGCQQQLSQKLPKNCAAAAAAAAHSTLGGEHPAVEAFADISTLLPSCSSDAWSAPLASAALAGPSCNWTSSIPVHYLPVLCNQAQSNIRCSSLPQLHPLVPPAAVAAAVVAAQAANPVSTRLDQLLPNVASSASGAALCCPTASGLDPWPAAALPSNTDSCSLSFTSQCTGFVPMTNPQLVAAQQLQQQQQQPRLLLLDDAWASESSVGLTSANVSFEASSKGAAAALTSEGLSLIDSSALLCSLGGATGAATASASGQHCPASLFDSSSSIQPADVSGLLPGASGARELFGSLNDRVGNNLRLSNNMATVVPSHIGPACYVAMQPCTSSGLVGSNAGLSIAAATAPMVAAGNQQQTVNLPLCDSAFCQLAPHIARVAKATGAELKITAGVSGMQLCMQGSAQQLDAACGLLRMVLPAVGQ